MKIFLFLFMIANAFIVAGYGFEAEINPVAYVNLLAATCCAFSFGFSCQH